MGQVDRADRARRESRLSSCTRKDSDQGQVTLEAHKRANGSAACWALTCFCINID